MRKSKYPPDWDKRAKRVMLCTLGLCGHCWFRRARLVHHVWYPWYWLQRFFVCLIPVCSKCHGECHKHVNWNPNRDGHNRFVFQLAIRFRVLGLVLVQWLGMAAVLLVLANALGLVGVLLTIAQIAIVAGPMYCLCLWVKDSLLR